MTSYAINGAGVSIPQAKTLLVHIVDHVAKTKPQALYAEFPVSPVTYDEGFRKVTYQAFANAINGIAWCLHDNLGPGKELETLAYIGPNNFIYPSLILGAVKAGYKVRGPTNKLGSIIDPSFRFFFYRLAIVLQLNLTSYKLQNAKHSLLPVGLYQS